MKNIGSGKLHTITDRPGSVSYYTIFSVGLWLNEKRESSPNDCPHLKNTCDPSFHNENMKKEERGERTPDIFYEDVSQGSNVDKHELSASLAPRYKKIFSRHFLF